MRFSTFVLALIPLALASPVDLEERTSDNTKSILTDLKNAGTQTSKLNTTLNGIADNAASITSSQEIALNNENSAILSALNAAIKASNSSSAFTTADSKSLNSAVVAQENPTFSVLNNLVAHKPAFANAGLTGLVLQNLQNQEEAIRELGNSLASKVTAPYQSQAPAIAAAYKAHFDSAISAFSS